MDKIEKILRSLQTKEQEAMLLLLQQLKRDAHCVPGMIPLAGKKGWYRVRMVQHRILFTIGSKRRGRKYAE